MLIKKMLTTDHGLIFLKYSTGLKKGCLSTNMASDRVLIFFKESFKIQLTNRTHYGHAFKACFSCDEKKFLAGLRKVVGVGVRVDNLQTLGRLLWDVPRLGSGGVEVGL
jgi:hypothetical protein